MYQDIISKKYPISVKLWKGNEVNNIIIAVHGFAGDNESGAIDAIARAMLPYGYLTVALDLPGHGKSVTDGDSLTIYNCLEDIETVENYYKEKYPAAKVNYFATSFGAYLTLLNIMRTSNVYNKIVLRCPAILMDKIFKDAILNEDMESFKERGYTMVGYERPLKVNYSFYQKLVDTNIFEIYQKNANKIMIIHGTNDDTAPISDSYKFRDTYQTAMKTVEGADHRFKKPGELDQVIDFAKDFYLN